MEVDDAYSLIERAIDGGRAANGYLIVGDLKNEAFRLVDRILRKLFPGAEDRLDSRTHPDVVWLEPQGRSRTIKVARGKNDDGPGMRDGLVGPMALAAFAGGWKVGVIVGADRMQAEAANAFLKSLEEPTPKTMYLLLTDAPDGILPTVVSRTQRIDLPRSAGLVTGEAYETLSGVFGSSGLDGVYAKAQAARQLAETLSALKDEAEDTEVAQVRRAFYRTILHFVRQWMIAGRLDAFRAYRNIEAVEAAARQSERYLPDEAVLSFMLDRMVFPS